MISIVFWLVVHTYNMCSIICPDDEEQNNVRSYVQMMRNKTFDVGLLTEQY